VNTLSLIVAAGLVCRNILKEKVKTFIEDEEIIPSHIFPIA
jgi:hypothetical protein